MSPSQRELLRRQYLADLCGLLADFVQEGHEVHVRTEHGRAPTDNQIVFEIPDWDAFAHQLEGAPVVARSG